MITIFMKTCECGEQILGPREGGKARGRWLGYDQCIECRESKEAGLKEPK